MNIKTLSHLISRLCFAAIAVVGVVLIVASYRDALRSARDVGLFYQLNSRIEKEGMPEGELLARSYEGACTSGTKMVKRFQVLNNRIVRLSLVMILLSLVGLASISKGDKKTAQQSSPRDFSKAADGLTETHDS